MLMNDEQQELLAEWYEGCVGIPINTIVAHQIMLFMKTYDISFDVIMMAVQETGFARYPTPRYFLAILKRCAQQHIHSLKDWEEENARHNVARTNSLWYTD